MSTYPNDHVFIVRVSYKTYVAFLSNTDHSRVKFFHNNEVVSASDVRPYIKRQYGREADWIKCMSGGNPFRKPSTGYHSIKLGGYTSVEDECIREEFQKRIGNEPSTDLMDYDSDNDPYMSSRKAQRVLQKRMDDAFEKYNERASQFPSFSDSRAVTDSEICEVMEWFSAHDRGTPQPTYGGVLDF